MTEAPLQVLAWEIVSSISRLWPNSASVEIINLTDTPPPKRKDQANIKTFLSLFSVTPVLYLLLVALVLFIFIVTFESHFIFSNP